MRVVREMSFVLLLFYPAAAREESSEQIDAIRDAYKELFSQQSVLRVDDRMRDDEIAAALSVPAPPIIDAR